jgi:hypothetical protein
VWRRHKVLLISFAENQPSASQKTDSLVFSYGMNGGTGILTSSTTAHTDSKPEAELQFAPSEDLMNQSCSNMA